MKRSVLVVVASAVPLVVLIVVRVVGVQQNPALQTPDYVLGIALIPVLGVAVTFISIALFERVLRRDRDEVRRRVLGPVFVAQVPQDLRAAVPDIPGALIVYERPLPSYAVVGALAGGLGFWARPPYGQPDVFLPWSVIGTIGAATESGWPRLRLTVPIIERRLSFDLTVSRDRSPFFPERDPATIEALAAQVAYFKRSSGEQPG